MHLCLQKKHDPNIGNIFHAFLFLLAALLLCLPFITLFLLFLHLLFFFSFFLSCFSFFFLLFLSLSFSFSSTSFFSFSSSSRYSSTFLSSSFYFCNSFYSRHNSKRTNAFIDVRRYIYGRVSYSFSPEYVGGLGVVASSGFSSSIGDFLARPQLQQMTRIMRINPSGAKTVEKRNDKLGKPTLRFHNNC